VAVKQLNKRKKSLKTTLYLPLIALAYSASAESNTSPQDIYHITPGNSLWEEKSVEPRFYDAPYRVSLFNAQHGEDAARLLSQTKSIFGYGFAVIGVLALMPTSVTNWESSPDSLGSKWVNNVQDGPVWDRDDLYINVIGHGYFGGVYYQAARKSGYRQWDAFIYSSLMSTFYWEYGIEAFAEMPSIQDIVITPVIGWAYGEWALQSERDIWLNGGALWDSEVLGNTALFLLDPVDCIGRNINYVLGKDVIKAGTGYFTFQQSKLPYGDSVENQIGFTISYLYGSDDSPALPGISGKKYLSSYRSKRADPVDTRIIGFGVAAVYVNPDDAWGITDGYGYQWSLGLYFSKRFSSRLNYSWADLKYKYSNQDVRYENYGLDMQYYINTKSDFRPFFTAGVGEIMFDESVRQKNFQLNAGLGLHYKVHNNWAVQSAWRHYYSRKTKRNSHQLSLSLIYRFAKGE